MGGWRPGETRARTKVLAAVGIAAVLTALIITAVIVPPLTVAHLATVTTPYAQIVGFLGGIAVIVTYVRKAVLSAVRATEDAAAQSQEAANQQQAASRKTDDAVEALRRQLADTQDARTREADRNDKVFTALLESQATSRNFIKWVAAQDLPRRVRRLEETEAVREHEAHIPGQLRLREMTTIQETE